ncbi:hypothetical protein OsI_31457 [Oryza sativa Indica Group]|uniref:Uncharacterized protein n=1 Tax=Oryza sativa subsp. indica TaxID=39946 RepID=A2Z1H4_ORYSI|nr:hypothetical protein OsI_31457 [Oryza sativa Indica Group]
MERPREPQAAGAAEQQQRRRSEQVCREQQQVAGQQEGKEKWKLAAPMEELETLIVCPVSTADKELEVHMANIAKLACTTPEGHCFGCLFLLKPGPNGLACLFF